MEKPSHPLHESTPGTSHVAIDFALLIAAARARQAASATVRALQRGTQAHGHGAFWPVGDACAVAPVNQSVSADVEIDASDGADGPAAAKGPDQQMDKT